MIVFSRAEPTDTMVVRPHREAGRVGVPGETPSAPLRVVAIVTTWDR